MIMQDHYYAVIMAGGGGTRLWPLSRQSRPKQMLNLFGDRSLYQTSIQRLEGLFPPERILVVTVGEQASDLRSQSPHIPEENFLLEPMPRGTAAVVGFAAVVLRKRDPEAIMAVLTADHFIGSEDRFRSLLLSAYEVAQDNYLVTLGIEPNYPATGFGYIQRGEPIGNFRGIEAFRVRRFTEKPNLEKAQEMLESGVHSWNSGMFIWRVANILKEFERQMPELTSELLRIEAVWGRPNQELVLDQAWTNIEVETIDYGIMEEADNVAVLPARGLDWNDVGSWDSLFDVLDRDEDGNIVMGGEHIGLYTRGSLICGEPGNRLIVTIGVEDLVVVDTGDVLLVCNKDQAQQVRDIVSLLRKVGPGYL